LPFRLFLRNVSPLFIGRIEMKKTNFIVSLILDFLILGSEAFALTVGLVNSLNSGDGVATFFNSLPKIATFFCS
jgi:hypothetical protein